MLSRNWNLLLLALTLGSTAWAREPLVHHEGRTKTTQPSFRSCGNTLTQEQRDIIHEKITREHPIVESCLIQPSKLGESVSDVWKGGYGADGYAAAIAALPAFTPLPGSGAFPVSKPKSVVKVYWNVVMKGPSLEQGNLTSKHVEDSIEKLNQAYKQTGLTFVLGGLKPVPKSNWFLYVDAPSQGGKRAPQEIAMKKELGVDDPSVLNVYSVFLKPVARAGTRESQLFGFSTFPWDYKPKNKLDGVVIGFWTVADVPRLDSNLKPPFLGMTLVHEVGHWAGLYHPFEGHSCDGRGDYVDDTPLTEDEIHGCPEVYPTCDGEESKDLIKNYMSYGDDHCVNHFTPGQIDRLKMMLALYRNIYA